SGRPIGCKPIRDARARTPPHTLNACATIWRKLLTLQKRGPSIPVGGSCIATEKKPIFRQIQTTCSPFPSPIEHFAHPSEQVAHLALARVSKLLTPVEQKISP